MIYTKIILIIITVDKEKMEEDKSLQHHIVPQVQKMMRKRLSRTLLLYKIFQKLMIYNIIVCLKLNRGIGANSVAGSYFYVVGTAYRSISRRVFLLF